MAIAASGGNRGGGGGGESGVDLHPGGTDEPGGEEGGEDGSGKSTACHEVPGREVRRDGGRCQSGSVVIEISGGDVGGEDGGESGGDKWPENGGGPGGEQGGEGGGGGSPACHEAPGREADSPHTVRPDPATVCPSACSPSLSPPPRNLNTGLSGSPGGGESRSVIG